VLLPLFIAPWRKYSLLIAQPSDRFYE
jgi:hypothetical protein